MQGDFGGFPLGRQPFGSQFLGSNGNPEFIEGLRAEPLVYVYTEDWQGHIRQKNSALAKCNQPWILAIDCDEVVSPTLRRAIAQKVNAPEIKGYCLNRRSFYLGKLLKYAWQPDWKLRLVHKRLNPRWGGYDPHDKLITGGETAKLEGDLIHYSYRDLGDHLARLVTYARITADSYYRDGRRFHWHHLIVNPVSAFIKKYVVRRSCLDGIQGFCVSVSSFIYVFLKYMFLWEIEQTGVSQRHAKNENKSGK